MLSDDLQTNQCDSGCLSDAQKAASDYRIRRPFYTVRETAAFLKVSESWVRRHLHQPPFVRVGRLVRIDSFLLLLRFQGKKTMGNRLKPERMVPMGFKRYQRGSVFKRGGRGKQMWYGMWREGRSGSRWRLQPPSAKHEARPGCRTPNQSNGFGAALDSDEPKAYNPTKFRGALLWC
jgi:hypothetical protein